MPEELTIAKLIHGMPERFMAEKAPGVDAVVQYHLLGEQGGEWVIRIGNGCCTVERGRTEKPNLAVTAHAADYLQIASGQLSAMSAFAEGKVKLEGDLALGLRMKNYFKRADVSLSESEGT
jgi:putative sterol carrier protein